MERPLEGAIYLSCGHRLTEEMGDGVDVVEKAMETSDDGTYGPALSFSVVCPDCAAKIPPDRLAPTEAEQDEWLALNRREASERLALIDRDL